MALAGRKTKRTDATNQQSLYIQKAGPLVPLFFCSFFSHPSAQQQLKNALVGMVRKPKEKGRIQLPLGMKIKIECRAQEVFLLCRGKEAAEGPQSPVLFKANPVNFSKGVHRFDLRCQPGKLFLAGKNKFNVGIESQVEVPPGFIQIGPQLALPL